MPSKVLRKQQPNAANKCDHFPGESMVELSKTAEVIAEPSLSQKEEESSKEQKPTLDYHPLQKRWSLWFKKDSAGASSWVGGQKLVHSFQTVEDFWS